MNSTELKAEFKILFEDLATNGSKGLDDYEISVCLTKGQELVIDSLLGQQDLEKLSPVTDIFQITAFTASEYTTARVYAHPSNSKRIIRRFLTSGDINQGQIPVVSPGPGPIDSMLMSPYKYPPKNLAYVIVEEDADVVFPPLSYDLKFYNYLFVQYPGPITIGTQVINGGSYVDNPPALGVDLHRTILEAAVNFAVKVYIGVPETPVNDGGSGNKR